MNPTIDHRMVFYGMETEFPNWGSLDARQKADLLRGCLSYRKHYEYLMDWYMRGKRLDESKRRINTMRTEINAESRKNTKDTLQSLNTLDGKISTSCDIKPTEKLFSMLLE
jgi:hypothetical protein